MLIGVWFGRFSPGENFLPDINKGHWRLSLVRLILDERSPHVSYHKISKLFRKTFGLGSVIYIIQPGKGRGQEEQNTDFLTNLYVKIIGRSH